MKANKRVTIVEIAEACGVSKTTVGYALDEKNASKVSPEKVSLIWSAVNRLGYVPNRAAKALRTQKTHTIGVMLPEPGNDFYGRLAISLQRNLAKMGYTAFFVFWDHLDDASSVDKALEMLLSKGVDGLIACELSGVRFEKSPVPVVFWQSAPTGFDLVTNYPCVKEIYREIVGFLKIKGCRRFAVLAPFLDHGRPPLILKALEEVGMPPAPGHFFGGITSHETARKAAREILLMNQRPDVVFGNNDRIAISAMSEMLNAGVKVPEEMRFVGFDGTDEAEYSSPPLTTFHVPVEEATEKLLRLLFRRMEDKDAEPLTLNVRPTLVMRKSA